MESKWSTIEHMTLASHIVAFLVLILGPALDPYMTSVLKRSTNPSRRVWNYAIGIAAMVAMSVVAVLYSPGDWWVVPGTWDHWGYTAVAAGLTLGLCYTLGKPVFEVLRKPGLRAKTHSQLDRLAFMLPQSRLERWMFAAICVSAGFGEEVIFRGFLIRYFMATPYSLPILVAAAVAVVAFGLNHIYQGFQGVIETAVTGLMFLVMAIGFHSLIPVMVIHFLVDLRVLLFTLPEGHALRPSPPEAPAPI